MLVRVARLLAHPARTRRHVRLRAMLRAADVIDTNVVGQRDVTTEAIRRHERERLQIRLVAAVGMHHLRTRVRNEATREDAIG